MTLSHLFHHDRTTTRRGWAVLARPRADATHDDSLRAGVSPHRPPTSLTACVHGGFLPR